jgi:hypothetical protein
MVLFLPNAKCQHRKERLSLCLECNIILFPLVMRALHEVQTRCVMRVCISTSLSAFSSPKITQIDSVEILYRQPLYSLSR